MNRDDRLLPDSADDEALFRDAEQAIRFALQANSRSPQRDTLAKLRKASFPVHDALLSRDDVPGQAGMILSALRELPGQPLALLVVKLAPRVRPCHCERACCSGWATDATWNAARAVVVDAIGEAFVEHRIRHYRLRDALVRRWSGVKVDLGRLADSVGVHRNTIGAHGKTAQQWLQQRYVQALAQAETSLRREAPCIAP